MKTTEEIRAALRKNLIQLRLIELIDDVIPEDVPKDARIGDCTTEAQRIEALRLATKQVDEIAELK